MSLVGIHGTITATNTIGVFAPQPTSKLMAIRLFTELDNVVGNYYPASVNNLTLTGLKTGSDIVVLMAGTTTIIASIENNSVTYWNYEYSVQQNVDIVVYKPGFKPYTIRNYALGTTDASIPVAQLVDLAYE